MKRRHLVGVTVLAGAIAVALLASATSGAKSSVVIGFASPILAGQPDQQALFLGQQKAGASLGWKVISLDAQLSQDKMIANIDSFVTKKVQGITTFALDPKASEPAFARAKAAGIPVVGYNSAAPSVATVIKQQLFWTCAPGQDAARFIAKLKPKAKVLVEGGAQVPVLNFVVQCFVDAAKKAGLTVLARQDNAKDSTATAQPIAADLLTKHSDVDAWWALNDTTAAGVVSALLAGGKTIYSKSDKKGVILVAGCCGSSLGADAIKAGRLTAVYDSQSPEAGAASIGAFAVHYRDGKPVSAMPKILTIPTVRYDLDNIGTYVPYTKRTFGKYLKVK
jgi:ribose transport system substrate-binding protein